MEEEVIVGRARKLPPGWVKETITILEPSTRVDKRSRFVHTGLFLPHLQLYKFNTYSCLESGERAYSWAEMNKKKKKKQMRQKREQEVGPATTLQYY